MSIYFVLDEKGEPQAEADVLTWGAWMEHGDRVVARDEIAESTISTVFLGMDHSFGVGAPILWETMVFGGPLNDSQDRCRGSREQAEAMHARMVAKVHADLIANPEVL